MILSPYLCREHLGMLFEDDPNVDISDPVCKTFYKGVWYARAAKNSHIYDRVGFLTCTVPL